jgi:hypothetical protein
VPEAGARAGLRHLGDLTRLTSLSLDWCQRITGAGVAEHVAPLTRHALSRLSLYMCPGVSPVAGPPAPAAVWQSFQGLSRQPARLTAPRPAAQDVKASVEHCCVYGASARRMPLRWPP